MNQYLNEDICRAGWFGVLLFGLMIAIWLAGIVCLCRKNNQTAVGMVEIIWLITALRICQSLIMGFYCCSGSLGMVQTLLLTVHWGFSFTMPIMDATILSLVVLLPLIFRKRLQPMQCHLLPGVLAGIGSIAVLLFTAIQAFVCHA